MSGRYVSLFSGIGGLDLAIEAFFGYEPAAFVEWDASCQRVLGTHWPDVPVFGDITAYSPDGGADLVCGGFPCQPASTAGKRKGTADDRWLWPEFARVVGELRPRHVLVENVAGLLTVNGGRAFSELIGDLASLGYDATWTSVRASDVGAPHRRERIFLLANALGPRLEGLAGDGAGGDEPRRLAPRSHRPAAEARVQPAPDAERGRREQRDEGERGVPEPDPRGLPASNFNWGAYEPAIRRWERVMGPAPHPVDEANRLSPDFVAWMMGFPAGWNDGQTRTNRLKQLGNAVVWQQAYAALSMLTATEAVA